MTSQSWKALTEERNTFLHVVFPDDDEGCDEYEPLPLRKCRSESDLGKVGRFISESTMHIMVDQFASTTGDKVCAKMSCSYLSECTSTAVPNDAPEMPSEHSWSEQNEQDVEDAARFSNAGRRKKIRPCKGQRLRRQKFVDKLRQLIDEHPEGFDIGSVDMPPSLAIDDTRKHALTKKLQEYQYRVLREREIETILQPLLQLSHQQNPPARFGQEWHAASLNQNDFNTLLG